MGWRREHGSATRRLVLAICAASLAIGTGALAQDPFVDGVTSFTPGTNAGFGADQLPAIVMGPPRGAGAVQGSLDVVSLGNGGVIVVAFAVPVICDGPGADFTVFENAFHSGSPSGPVFAEYGIVAVSQDGVNFIELPYDAGTHVGLAGQTPVLSNPSNGIDPLDPAVSGGDQFDLASVGLAWASYVRITDPGATIPDPGNAIPPGTNSGFDLDAIAALHGCDPATLPSVTPTRTVPPVATPTHTAAPATATRTATAAPSHDAAVLPRKPLRVRIGKGKTAVDARVRVKVRNADASGSVPIRVTASGCPAVVATTIDFDRRSDGPQDTATISAGRKKAPIIMATLSSALVSTPQRTEPLHCLLTITAGADVAGNIDPTPSDNTTAIELLVVDLNDTE